MGDNRLRIAIVGGGIGGLSFALSIAKLVPDFDSRLQVDIYESTSNLKAQVGAGIGVWPFAWAILETLGLDKEFVKYTQSVVTEEPVDLLRLRRADQPEGRDLFKMRTSCGAIIFFHRGDFQKVLLDNVPSSMKIHTNKRLRSYTQHAADVELQFEDGTNARADLIIGADGLQSRVRKTMIEELAKANPSSDVRHLADPNWTGLLTYRALIPRQKLLDSGWHHHPALSSWTVYSGKNAAMMAYPVSLGANVNFVGFRLFPEHEGKQFSQEIFEDYLKKEGFTRTEATTNVKAIGQDPVVSNEVDPWSENGGGGRTASSRARWVAKVSPDEVKNSYKGWEPEVQAILNGIDAPLAWAVHKVGPLHTYINGKVCLLGDAAHAMQPSHGVGAGQGIYDSYILAVLFAAAASKGGHLKLHVPAVLETYDTIRRPAVATAAGGSRDAVFLYMGRIRTKPGVDDWKTADVNDERELKMLQDQMTEGYSYAWDKPAALKDAERAKQMLHERLSPSHRNKSSKGFWRKVLKWTKLKLKPSSVRHGRAEI